MALRFSTTNVAILATGSAFAHGLKVDGADTAPDEWAFNSRSGTNFALYLVTSPTTTNITIAGATNTTGDLFAVVNHSIIR